MWLNKWTNLFMWLHDFMSHHLVMCGVQWSNAGGDITYLICHVISQDHIIDRSCDVMGKDK